MLKLICATCGTLVELAGEWHVHIEEPPPAYQREGAPHYCDHAAAAVPKEIRTPSAE